MQTITTIGLDIAKSVFQVHGVDAAGQVANGNRACETKPALSAGVKIATSPVCRSCAARWIIGCSE